MAPAPSFPIDSLPSDDVAGGIAVRVRALINRFGGQTIHQGLNLDIRCHEILGLVGPSGAGKSLLMRSIIGLHRPQSGHIDFPDMDPNLSGSENIARAMRWGVLFQDGALFSSLTTLDNVLVPLRTHCDFSPRLMREIAKLKITLVGLPPESHELYPSQLSGGMRKRAGLARALALDQPILFLDEPTAGLDPTSTMGFTALIDSLHRALGLTVVMISHDVDSLFRLCHRIAVLDHGGIVAIDTIPALAALELPQLHDYFSIRSNHQSPGY